MLQTYLKVRIHPELPDALSSWERFACLPESSMHQGLTWCHAWAKTHRRRCMLVELIGPLGTVLMLPLEISSFGPFRTARFIGSEFSNLNTLLVDDRMPIDSVGLMESLRTHLSPHADLLLLEKMVKTDAEGRLVAAFRPALGVNASFQLELGPDFGATLSRLDAAKRMKKFRSTARKFDAAGGWRWGEATDQSLALDLFFKQKAARFRAMELPDVFARAETKEFFRRLVSAPKRGDDYTLRLFTLDIGDNPARTVAIAGLTRQGHRVTCQFGSIDDTASPGSSPGDFLFHLLIQGLSGSEITVFDFGIGDQPYKRAWCNVVTALYDFTLPLSAKGAALAYALGVANSLKRWIKARPDLYGVIQSARSRLQKGIWASKWKISKLG
jgi:CelD/BcsL family acetyltransferase involved in cellulose biosynthesis